MDLLQRVCWNQLEWRGPSAGRLGTEDSYVGRNGFGHEDWNFNTSDLHEGYVYGYAYFTPPEDGGIGLGPHDMYFYGIRPDKQRVFVGAYRNAVFLRAEERESLRVALRGTDYLERRAEEVLALEVPHLDTFETALAELDGNFPLNIRVAPEDVYSFVPHIPLEDHHVGGTSPKRLSRYVRPKRLSSAPVLSKPTQDLQQPQDLLTEHYLRVTGPASRVIERRHNELSNKFKHWLIKAKAEFISVEAQQIDCECIYLGERYRFELKTCTAQPTRRAVREALGQILEYAYYPGRSPCDNLAIVLDSPPASDDITWLSNLVIAGLPVELYWLKGPHVYSASLTPQPLSQQAVATQVSHITKS